jgi:hypothetical protein
MMSPLASHLVTAASKDLLEPFLGVLFEIHIFPARETQSAGEVAEEQPLLLAVEGVDREVCLSLAAKALPLDSRS